MSEKATNQIFEMVIGKPRAFCAICQAVTTNRFRLDSETLLIACSQNHAGKLFERIFGRAPLPTVIAPAPEKPIRRNSKREVIEPGTRYNRLRYVGPAENLNGCRADEWLCDCGTKTIKQLGNVKSGMTKSCSRTCRLNKRAGRKAA